MATSSASSLQGRAVTAAEVESYRQNGVVTLRNLFSESELILLDEAVHQTVAQPSKHSTNYSLSDTKSFVDDSWNWSALLLIPSLVLFRKESLKGWFRLTRVYCRQRLPSYLNFAMKSACGPAAARLLRSSSVRFFHEHLVRF